MIEFMVIAAPRSGTTWAANWLTTDTTLCIHDPLWEHQWDGLDKIESKKTLGISCTALALIRGYANRHKARKVILHRDTDEIDSSLLEIGLPQLGQEWNGALDSIEGYHCEWQDIFYNPRPIYEHLLQLPFDSERHAELMKIRMQPAFEKLTVNRAAVNGLIRKMKEAAKC